MRRFIFSVEGIVTSRITGRDRRRLAMPALLLVLVTVAVLIPAAARTADGDIGHEGPSYSGTSLSSSKPVESRLWFNDSHWWASMWDSVSQDFHIFRLDTATQKWVDTGVPIDTRSFTRQDALWDGTHLYIASHKASGESFASGNPSYLYRYSYDAATDKYTKDTGFPVQINNYLTETLVIEKDSTGKLWATWMQDNKIYVNRTIGDDKTWGTPFVPALNGINVSADDNSSLVAFGGNKIGLMWSNQATSAMYFATHVDGDADSAWQSSRTALQGPNNADDHINLKSLQSDGSGRVFAAVKTSHSASSSPLIMLLVRNASTGDWDSHVYGRVSDCHTRAMLLIDEENKKIHLFATGPQTPTGCDSAVTGTIYEKRSPLDEISFPSGIGTPVIRDADSARMNNSTSTKQNVNSATGLVVLADNSATSRYWHHYDAIAPPPAPSASFTASPTTGTAPLSVAFTDTSAGSPTSWSWDFGDGTPPSTARNPAHTYAFAGTYTVTLTATNAQGSDTETKADYISARMPLPPTADFTATPTTGAAPLRVSFSDRSTDATSWSWDFQNDGVVDSTAANPTFAYGSAGTYTVTLTATNGLGSDSETKLDYITVDVPPPPTAGFTATPTTGTAPLTVRFTDTSTGSPTSWSWDFQNDGTVDSTTQNPTWTYDAAGAYTVALTATNEGGADTETKVAYVVAVRTATFSPDGDADVSSSKPTRNHGTTTTLRVRGGSSTNYRSYVRFAVSGLNAPVESAKLRLYVTDESNGGGSVYLVGSTWGETTITWNNAPAISGNPLANVGATTLGTWVELDVSSAITGNGTYSFAIRIDGTSSHNGAYSSREGTNPPELVVTT